MFYCTSLTKIFVMWLFSGKIHLYENSFYIKQTQCLELTRPPLFMSVNLILLLCGIFAQKRREFPQVNVVDD